MTLPLASEETWLAALRSNRAWEPPAVPTLVISPHPDDETLGAGGLIALQRRRGLPVTVVAVTDGEAAYADTPGLAEVRRQEQEQALAHLGVHRDSIMRLGLPDSGVSACAPLLQRMLGPLLTAGILVVAPWRHDPHPDHEAVGRAADALAPAAGATLVSYFFWTWHRNQPDSLRSLPLVNLMLDERSRQARAEALAEYRSQLARPGGPPILPEPLLSPARRPFETFVFQD